MSSSVGIIISNIWKIIQMTPPKFDQHLAKVRICWSRLWIWLSRTKQWIFQPCWLPEAINIDVIFHPMIFLIISQYIFIISPDIVGYKLLYIYIHIYIPIRRFPENGGPPKHPSYGRPFWYWNDHGDLGIPHFFEKPNSSKSHWLRLFWVINSLSSIIVGYISYISQYLPWNLPMIAIISPIEPPI